MTRELAVVQRPTVRVVIDDDTVPAWITLMLDDVRALDPSMHIEMMIAPRAPGGEGPRSHRGSGARLLASVDASLFGRRTTHLDAVDVHRWARARGVPVATGSGYGSRMGSSASLGEQPGLRPLLLDLARSQARQGPDIAGSEGVWWLEGVPTSLRDRASDLAYLGSLVLRGVSVAQFSLRARGPAGEAQVSVAARFPVHPTSPLMTADYLGASARQLLARTLVNTRARTRREAIAGVATPSGSAATDSDRLDREAGAAPPSRPSPTPSSGTWAWRRIHRFACGVAKRQADKAIHDEQWQLLLGRRDSGRLLPDPARCRPVSPPPGRYWADPFLVEFDGETHLFFEEFVYEERKGRIAVTTLDRSGHLEPPSTALELDTHLSYPCVFTHEGRLFMVPESSSTATLDLYECSGLPARWARRRTLLSGVQLVDASIFPWGGLWWLFASLKKPPELRTAELLLLYWTHDPIAGTWREHPASPLCADVTNARPAGAPFVYDGNLYRLAQDGSGGYGRAIAVNEVLALTPTDYLDRRVATLAPVALPGARGMHTLNHAGDLVVMDVCRRVRRPPWQPRSDSMLD